MGKRIAVAQAAEVETSFGERLASLRKAAGFTQVELAAELREASAAYTAYGFERLVPRRDVRITLLEGAARPTAVVAQSDLLAIGVIRAAESLGIRVPDELSVVGFDGVQIDELGEHDLTTVIQPAQDKGRAAGRAAVELVGGGTPQSMAFTSELHIGSTTAARGQQ